MSKLNNKVTFLRTYPVEWPVFSTKNYIKDIDGWWNYVKKIRYKKNEFSSLKTYEYKDLAYT